TINKEIVTAINRHGGKAVGLTGKDGSLITARQVELDRPKKNKARSPDMGMAGEVEEVDPRLLSCLEGDRFIPVIAPIGADREGKGYNINADIAAGSIASALKTEKLIFLTDVKGILDKDGRLLSTLSKKETTRLIRDEVISDGMLPKVRSCLAALEGGVKKTHIIDGRIPHAILLEIFTDKGIGTEIVS
ncbi:MAG: acetylglutamate kinase, partial [Nitrospirota bacterium]